MVVERNNSLASRIINSITQNEKSVQWISSVHASDTYPIYIIYRRKMKQTVLSCNADGVERRNDLSIRLVVYLIPTHFTGI